MNTESMLPILFELLAKSVLVSCSAALFVRAWRGATAAQRHLVWLVALATVMMLPATRLVAPFWKIPLTPAKKVTVVAKVLPAPSLAERPAFLVADEAPVQPATRTPTDWRKVLLGGWLSGSAILLGYRLFGSWRLHGLLRRSVRTDDPRVQLLLTRTLRELGLRRRPEVRLSGECRVPITWSTLRPVLLLPEHALEWSDAWLTAALRHEAAHIVRYDSLTRWIAQFAAALYWPNPFVWLAVRGLRLAQEQAADDLVLRAGTPADDYATQLVDAARAVAAHGLFVREAVAMACPSTLEDRVRSIVDGDRDRRPLSRLAASVGSIMVLLTLAVFAAAQLRGADPTTPSEDKASGQAAAKGPQVVILTRIVELTNSVIKPDGPLSEAAMKPVYSEPEAEALIRLLNQKKGVDLVTAPTVATRPGQPASVEVVREFRYATEWTKGPRDWEPKEEATENVGVTVEVIPEIKDGGNIELRVKPSLSQFEGYRDLDAPNKFPAPNSKGRRLKPLFSTARQDTTVTLKSGETAAITGINKQLLLDGKLVEGDPQRLRLIIFITARVVEAKDLVITGNVTLSGVNGDGAAPPAATPAGDRPPALTLTKTGTGTLVLSGLTPGNASTGLTVTGGTLTFTGTYTGTEPAPASHATVRLLPHGERFSGESVTTEKDGVVAVKGDARLNWVGQDMSAQSIRYHPTTRQVDLTGQVVIRDGASVIEADDLTVWLVEGGRIKIQGPHKTTVVPTPATRPPEKP